MALKQNLRTQGDVATLAPPRLSDRALDFGCGPGGNGLWLAPQVAHVTLYDPSEPMLRLARQRAEERGLDNVTFVSGSASEAAAAGPFDLVLASFVLHHDAKWQETMGVLAGGLASGGVLLVHELTSPTMTADALAETAAVHGLGVRHSADLPTTTQATSDGREVPLESYIIVFHKPE